MRARHGKAKKNVRRLTVEQLESRVNPTSVFVPPPFVPNLAEQLVLNQANSPLVQNNPTLLDNWPIPFQIYTQAEGAPARLTHAVPNVPIPINADGNLLTGVAGFDVVAMLKTELLPTPHLVFEVDRIGSGSLSLNLSPLLSAQIVLQTKLGLVDYVEDLTVLAVFPFEAFNSELLPGLPNLFAGYQTRAAGDMTGGIAPAVERMVLTPNIPGFPQILGGTDHTLELKLETFGASNPIRYLGGEFDDLANHSKIVGAYGAGVYVETPPQNITVGVDVSETPLAGGAIESAFDVTWTATARSLVEFDYFEDETFSPTVDDFHTTLTVDKMPTSEKVSVRLNETARTVNVTHDANAVINTMTLLHERADGLLLIGTATDVPTHIGLDLDLRGAAKLDVNANTLDLQFEAIKVGGFLNTADFLGYDLGYASLKVSNIPDLTVNWNAAESSFNVKATNPGEAIGAVEFVIDDDAHYDAAGLLKGLELPPAYDAVPPRHLLSFIDDGTHGTAAARLVGVVSAKLDLDADASEAFQLELLNPTPLQAYLRTGPGSNLIPGHDIEITTDVTNFPAGTVEYHYEGLGDNGLIDFGFTTNPPQTIDSVHSFGHFDNLNFDVDVGGLPAVFGFAFDPNGSLAVLAEDGTGPNTATIGHIAVRLWDEDGPGLLPTGTNLLGVNLREARARVDRIPTFIAAWSNTAAGTAIDFHTDAADGFVEGVQVAVSTQVDLAPLAPATPTADHYARFVDHGPAKQLAAGAFGIHQLTYASDNATRTQSFHYTTNTEHRLVATVDADFGGIFFPAFDVLAVLTVDAVPQTWDVTTNLATEFHYTASSGIDAVTLTGAIDTTDNAVADGTTIDFAALGLPSEVHFVLNPATDVSLVMNAPIDLIAVTLSSNAGIFGSPFRLVQAALDDIPAQWTADWSDGQFVLESKDATGNPAPMGSVSGLVSTSNSMATNAARLAPFGLNGPVQGGAILQGTAGGSRIDYSAFSQEVDFRYYDESGAPSVFARLRDLYAGSEELDTGEDHALASIQGGDLEIASFKFSGLQKLAYQPSDVGGHFELKAPTPGLHPFFAGARLGDNAVTVQIENVPDSMTLDIDTGGTIHFNSGGESAGQIDAYFGPLPVAGDGDTAVRAVMNDTPSDVLITWGFGFPTGGANFTASNTFELLFLAQSGGTRLVGGLELKELQAGYDIDVLPLTVDTDEIPPGIPVSIDLRLLEATAGIDNDTADPNIVGNDDKPGVNGFFQLYELLDDQGNDALQTLDPPGPAPGANEYVPLLTFMMKDFTEFSISMAFDVGIFPDILVPQIEGPNITLDGEFVLDLFSNADTDFSSSFLGIDFGFRNPPDYRDNRPIHLIPFGSPRLGNPEGLVVTFEGFHDFDDHVDPFGAMTAALAPSVSVSSPALTSGVLTPFVAEALDRWARAGVPAELLDGLRGVRFEVADLPYLTLGRHVPGLIQIDIDAAGFGWFIDPTPSADEEFGDTVDPAAGRMDLLTVLSHEIGHLLGFDHHDAERHGAMFGVLAPGVRLVGGERNPSPVGHSVAWITSFDTPGLYRTSAPTTPPAVLDRSKALAVRIGEQTWDELSRTTKSAPSSGNDLVAAHAQRPSSELPEDERDPIWVG